MGVGAGLNMYDVVVKKFTFAVSYLMSCLRVAAAGNRLDLLCSIFLPAACTVRIVSCDWSISK